jgi:hypothetical protein
MAEPEHLMAFQLQTRQTVTVPPVDVNAATFRQMQIEQAPHSLWTGADNREFTDFSTNIAFHYCQLSVCDICWHLQ